MTDHTEQHLDTVREDFEAWERTKPLGYTTLELWQAATQRSAERITYVEKIAEDAIELCTQQAIRVMELEAQVEALREANDTFANNAIAKDAT